MSIRIGMKGLKASSFMKEVEKEIEKKRLEDLLKKRFPWPRGSKINLSKKWLEVIDFSIANGLVIYDGKSTVYKSITISWDTKQITITDGSYSVACQYSYFPGNIANKMFLKELEIVSFKKYKHYGCDGAGFDKGSGYDTDMLEVDRLSSIVKVFNEGLRIFFK